MKCREQSDILMSSCTLLRGDTRRCEHKFCESCFRKDNRLPYLFSCPCCRTSIYYYLESIEEAVLFGEVATTTNYISPYLLSENDTVIAETDIIRIDEMNISIIVKLETALRLNCFNFCILYCLFRTCWNGKRFLSKNNPGIIPSSGYYRYVVMQFGYASKIIDFAIIPEVYMYAKNECFYILASTFSTYRNYPAALKYAKLAYEHCLRSPDHTELTTYKDLYLESRAHFDELPPLRFAVGDEVEFLHELETGSEWKLGKVVELYYREAEFDINFSTPYRLQLLDASGSTDQQPVYAWVKADLDRYVRKVGVRSIEDTRYQARLDVKVEELAQIYCSKEFIHELYLTLSQDQEFVEMLQSVWQIELSVDTLRLYRLLVMYRQPLVRTDIGYHVPSSEEVIAEIKAYFDPAHLSVDTAPSTVAVGEDSCSKRVRAELYRVFRGIYKRSIDPLGDLDVQRLLFESILSYMQVLFPLDPYGSTVNLEQDSDFTVPIMVSRAFSKISSEEELRLILFNNPYYRDRTKDYIDSWIALHACLDNPNAGPACECPFLYFLVKWHREQGAGIPKLALALYDRMNMQLSREFIRCANPTCELNKLDKSTGKVKFKQCSHCHAAIYCSRECQVAHYPEHKTLCRKHSGGKKGS